MITGVEVSTRQGHLIGLFVTRAPGPGRPVEESIDAIKQQGGLVIVPHPLGRLVPSLSRRRIDSLLAAGYAIDGIEMYNPSPANAAQRAVVRAGKPCKTCAGPSSSGRSERAARSSRPFGSTPLHTLASAPGAGLSTRRGA